MKMVIEKQVTQKEEIDLRLLAYFKDEIITGFTTGAWMITEDGRIIIVRDNIVFSIEKCSDDHYSKKLYEALDKIPTNREFFLTHYNKTMLALENQIGYKQKEPATSLT